MKYGRKLMFGTDKRGGMALVRKAMNWRDVGLTRGTGFFSAKLQYPRLCFSEAPVEQ
jgi:hypothetical protein